MEEEEDKDGASFAVSDDGGVEDGVEEDSEGQTDDSEAETVLTSRGGSIAFLGVLVYFFLTFVRLIMRHLSGSPRIKHGW